MGRGQASEKRRQVLWLHRRSGVFVGCRRGILSNTGKLGYIASNSIPQVLRSINNFTMGARSANPKVTTTVVFTGGWSNPAKAPERGLLERFAGVIETCAIPVIALLVSLVLFGVFIAFTGRDPFAVYATTYKGAFGSWFSW